MSYIIGVDIGGTKISVVIARKSGSILEKYVLSTQVRKNAERSLNDILSTVKTLLKKWKAEKQLEAIGVGVPGAIDPVAGVITQSPNLPGWAGIPIGKLLQRTFHVPIFLDNDANVACLGEKFFGSGKGLKDFIYITVSTGVGGGIVANGRLLHGARGYAGEIGHMVVHPNGRKCNCGKCGCIEAHASGTAIAKIAQERLRTLSAAQRKRSKLWKVAKEINRGLNAYDVEQAARAGDAMARAIYKEMGTDLGLGLSSMIQMFNPQAIIFGGGVMKAYPLFRSAMRKTLKQNVWTVPLRNCSFMRAKLGVRVADLGTIALVKENTRL